MAHSKTNLDKPASDPAAQGKQSQAMNDSPVGAEVIGLSLEPAQLRFDEDDEEMARRIRGEAERLATYSEFECALWLPKRAREIGVPQSVLNAAVNAIRRQHAAEQKVREQEERALARREKERERQRAKQAEKQQREAEKEAKRKQQERTKALAALAGLPVARQQARLERLAERLGEDIAVLQQELADLIGAGDLGTDTVEETEPWPQPVKTAAVLQALQDKIAKHAIMQPQQLTAAVLWTAHAWLYDHDVPTHSPILAFSSAEADSGKTTAASIVGHAAPRHMLNVEMTGPSLFRLVDAIKPTLIIDEADDLFTRKGDLKHIINAGWTRGTKIARQVKVANAWTTVYFDPFTPKVIALLGRNLPQTVRTRSVEIRMLPKRLGEKVAAFDHIDDPEFAMLRRKLARWGTDYAAALKAAKPAMPTGMNNRTAANWKLLFAIADLAGGKWPERAREAAEQLTRKGRLPSDGMKLLGAIRAMFAKSGKKVLASKAIVDELIKNQTDIWVAYNHGGAVTQRQVAHLLSAYDITPSTVHPTGRSSDSPQGYKLAQFEDAFARFLPADPHIHTLPSRARTRRKKLQKRRKK